MTTAIEKRDTTLPALHKLRDFISDLTDERLAPLAEEKDNVVLNEELRKLDSPLRKLAAPQTAHSTRWPQEPSRGAALEGQDRVPVIPGTSRRCGDVPRRDR
jgi:hypothetical protein